MFEGKKHLITARRQQILDLLFSTYENAAYKNRELELANSKLIALQRKLEKDILERRQAEERLFESEQRLKLVLNTVQTGVVIIDVQTHVISDVNQYAADLIGLSKERIIGKHLPAVHLSGAVGRVSVCRNRTQNRQLGAASDAGRWGASFRF